MAILENVLNSSKSNKSNSLQSIQAQNIKFANISSYQFSKVFESANQSFKLSYDKVSAEDYSFKTNDSMFFQNNFNLSEFKEFHGTSNDMNNTGSTSNTDEIADSSDKSSDFSTNVFETKDNTLNETTTHKEENRTHQDEEKNVENKPVEKEVHNKIKEQPTKEKNTEKTVEKKETKGENNSSLSKDNSADTNKITSNELLNSGIITSQIAAQQNTAALLNQDADKNSAKNSLQNSKKSAAKSSVKNSGAGNAQKVHVKNVGNAAPENIQTDENLKNLSVKNQTVYINNKNLANPEGHNDKVLSNKTLISNKNAQDLQSQENQHNKNATVQNAAKQTISINNNADSSQGLEVKVAQEQLGQNPNAGAGKVKINLAKINPNIAAELKTVVTKIDVSQNNAKGNFNNQSSNRDFRADIQQIQGIQSAQTAQNIQNADVGIAKMQFDRANQFNKVLETAQTGQSNQINEKSPEKSIMEQVINKAAEQVNQNKTEISLSLRPDNLGKVNINLVTKDGALTAQITAESNHVKDILTKGIESLKQSLEEHGVNVSNITVKVQEPAQTENSSQNQFEQSNQSFANSNHNNQTQQQQATASNYEGQEEYGFEEEPDTEASDGQQNSHDGQVDYTV